MLRVSFIRSVMLLVILVFCNLFFELTLEGLHRQNKTFIYLFIHFVRFTLSSGCSFEENTLIFLTELQEFFLTQRLNVGLNTLLGRYSVLVWHKRGSACPTMHCSCLIFCLERTRFLVAFKLFRVEAKYFPLLVPRGQPCPSLAICFSVCSRHRRPCWSPPYPPKIIFTIHPARAIISFQKHALLV